MIMEKKEKKDKGLELELCCTLAEKTNRVQHALWELVPNSETARKETFIVRQQKGQN